MLDKIDSIAMSVQKWIGTILVHTGACAVVLWVFVMTLNIMLRFLFNVNWHFVDEYTGYFHLVCGSFGFAYATYKGKHIVVRIFSSRFRDRAKYIHECVTVILAIWWVAFLSSGMVGWVSDAIKEHTVSLQTQTPLWVIILILAIGLCSLLLSFLIHLFHAVVLTYRGQGEIVEDELKM
jgi:TRAP-type C4-dicarboxylate transport system permease small subunit